MGRLIKAGMRRLFAVFNHVVERNARCLRQAWRAHRARLASDAVYAAATGALAAGVLGTAGARDVLAALLFAAASWLRHSRRPASPPALD